MFVVVPNSLKNHVEDVSPEFWRVQALILKFDNSSLLLLNTYFPVDNRGAQNDEAELIVTLQHIKQVIDNTRFNNILWVGDINTDFSRRTNHVNSIKTFMEDNSLQSSWSKFSVDFTCSHDANEHSFISTIDHFLLNDALLNVILDAGVIHDIDNLSDHSPIYCQFDVDNVKVNEVDDMK